jgi:hypothetical protein
MILIRLVLLPVRLGLKTTGFAVKTGYRTGRFFGYRRILVLGTGIAIGLLIAPVPGRQLRAKLAAFLAQFGPPPTDLGEQVRFELSHSPKTWHLPQPDVVVREGTVVLTGNVPHASAKADIEQAATGVPGVSGVQNMLTVTGTNGQN